MKVSVVIASCNQGKYIAKTCSSIRNGLKRSKIKHEIIVVDDCSTDASCTSLRRRHGIRVLRTSKRLGCAQSRRFGAAATSGDVLVFSDPHCLFPIPSLPRLALLAAREFAIWQPQVYLENIQAITSGCAPRLRYCGVRMKVTNQIPKRPGLLGSIYAMSRNVYDKLGGWPWLPGKWGKDEQAVTLLAYLHGIPIRIDIGNVCLHLVYRKPGKWPFSVTQTDIAKNNFWTHALAFPETWDTVWNPLLSSFHGKSYRNVDIAGVRHSLTHRRFRWQFDYLMNNRKLSELDLYRTLFNVDHPTKRPGIAKALAALI